MAPALRIATRGSPLARWQAEHVRDRLRAADPERPVELVVVASAGDLNRTAPLHQLGGVGLFTKEIQAAVLDGRADLAVHSLKDLPTAPHAALALAAIPERADPADALIAPRHGALARLPRGATVATSSLRRRAQLLRRRPDLNIVDVRGNVETRLKKLDDGGLDAIVLAAAGLDRLKLADRITERFSPEVMLSAVGQGALGIECRADDANTRAALAFLDHPATRAAVLAERMFLATLEGGCQLPIGALALATPAGLRLHGKAWSIDGQQELDGVAVGADPLELGRELGVRLLAQGAAELLGGRRSG
jgi:hydroxymethylbilane synthase